MIRKSQNGTVVVECELCTCSVGMTEIEFERAAGAILNRLRWIEVGVRQWVCSSNCAHAFRIGKAAVVRAHAEVSRDCRKG